MEILIIIDSIVASQRRADATNGHDLNNKWNSQMSLKYPKYIDFTSFPVLVVSNLSFFHLNTLLVFFENLESNSNESLKLHSKKETLL